MMYAKIAALIFILATVGAGYYYVSDLQDKVVDLNKANTKYQLAVKELNFNIEVMSSEVKENELRLERFNKKLSANAEQVNEIRTKLAKHDLGKIIQRKPKLFEKIAQKGTDKYYKDLEEATK